MARVLLVAPSVDATDVGEAWVAYQWASRLSERHEVTLLTHRKRTRPSARGQLPGVEVVEWDEPPFLGRAERFNSLLKPWYPRFARKCRHWIRDAQRQGRAFDVGHQPVPVGMRYPSPLAASGIPYVIGPVGGGLSTPPGFAEEDTAPWYVTLRRLDGWRLRHDPALRRTYARAAVVVGIADYVKDSLSTIPIQRFIAMSETALESVPGPVEREPHTPVRLLFVGRLIRTKGARDAIRAMSLVPDLPVLLDVVGDGFDRDACERLVADLGLEERVFFHGAQPRARVDEFYRRADVFVFPSYREPGGNVAYEAMGHGLPLIVSDRGGPGAAVTDDCGYRITPESPQRFASDIAEAIRALVEDPDRRVSMGAAARDRVLTSGTWDARIRRMEEIYLEVMSPRRATTAPEDPTGRA